MKPARREAAAAAAPPCPERRTPAGDDTFHVPIQNKLFEKESCGRRAAGDEGLGGARKCPSHRKKGREIIQESPSSVEVREGKRAAMFSSGLVAGRIPK